ncbi:PREDICTED: zinc finger protein 36, C3H1 type-like 1 [Nanorana parkeri]|uniref:zinc finger protein 36, C3H1 type-like 1 n=1 Tax=Nanorana parkeri TaxID=125878 RepID=UPI000854D936|nr:PREDICTED: zinc finger protein 36, C3H1 type-like 1 [Nanorana parkeri]
MPSNLLSPFHELDADLPKDFVSLFSGVSLKSAVEEQPSTHSSCPVNLNDDAKSKEISTDSTAWPLQSPWCREAELPSLHPLRLIPFQADRSVSMIEESRKTSAAARLPSSRYKTELCRTFHESGSCKYGSKCQFAHGTAELRGLNRHPKYKTELCRTYHTIGFCPYGSRCHFIHNAEEQRFNSGSRGHRPPLLRHSISCSGIPSSSSSSSLSLFSSSIASSLSSLSPFSPSSPVTLPSNPFASVGPSSPTSPPPVTLNLPLFRSVSPPRPNVQNTLAGGLQLQLSPWKRGDPKGEERWDSLSHPESEESASAFANSQEAKRLPIFSFLSD